MASELRLGGFEELRAELEALPRTLQGDADPILSRAAKAAQATVRGMYPSVTGTLRNGVTVFQRVGRGIASIWAVRTSAPYAHIYEFGSARQRPHATFLPVTTRDRRAAVVVVAKMVEGHGLQVQGERD